MSFMSFLPDKTLAADSLMIRARAMASRAQDFAPTEAWVQSALAWVLFVGGEYLSHASGRCCVQLLVTVAERQAFHIDDTVVVPQRQRFDTVEHQ